MKSILAIIALCLATACSAEQLPAVVPAQSGAAVQTTKPAEEPNKVQAPVVTRVCINVWDAKLNREVRKCRTLKLHKKHEGTEVPPAKGSK